MFTSETSAFTASTAGNEHPLGVSELHRALLGGNESSAAHRPGQMRCTVSIQVSREPIQFPGSNPEIQPAPG